MSTTEFAPNPAMGYANQHNTYTNPQNIAEALNVDSMDAYRNRQWSGLQNHIYDHGHNIRGDFERGKQNFMASELPGMNADFLSRYNVTPQSDNYTTYSKLLGEASINPFDRLGDDWNRPDENGETHRMRYEKQWQELFAPAPDPNAQPTSQPAGANGFDLGGQKNWFQPDQAQNPTNPERTLQELHEDITRVAGEKNTAFADRMKMGFIRGWIKKDEKARLQDVIDTKEQELDGLLTLRNERLEAELRQSLNDDQVAEKMAEVMNSDINHEAQGQRKSMIAGNLGARALDAYSRLNGYEKLIVTGTATVIAAPIIGAAAGAVGAAGVVVMGVTRGVRTYYLQRSKMYEVGNQPEPITHLDENNQIKTVAAMQAEATQRRVEFTNRRIEEADKTTKRAFYVSMGSAAMVGISTAVEHWDTAKEAAGKLKDGIGNVWGSLFGGDKVNALETQPSPHPGGPETGTPPPPVERPMPGSLDPNKFGAALTIENGEGLLQTFGEAGINDPTQRAALLRNQALMSELEKMGVVYRDARPEIGGWGMNLGNGRLSTEALKTIRDHASRNGYTLAG